MCGLGEGEEEEKFDSPNSPVNDDKILLFQMLFQQFSIGGRTVDLLISGFEIPKAVTACTAMFRHVVQCTAMFRHVMACTAMFRHVMQCTAMFRHVMPCTAMFRHVMPCTAMFVM